MEDKAQAIVDEMKNEIASVLEQTKGQNAPRVSIIEFLGEDISKLDRLQIIGVDIVHIGICAVKDRETGGLCPTMETLRELLHSRGIKTIVGTH